jgi:threonine/homoserine/homoserine lactone efflux protein
MRSLPELLAIALLVTITPGPGTATVLRVAARDGRAAARGTILGNSADVLTWGVLSAVGVSSLILASQIDYDVLRIGGATVLVVLGARSLLARHRGEHAQQAEQVQGGERHRRAGPCRRLRQHCLASHEIPAKLLALDRLAAWQRDFDDDYHYQTGWRPAAIPDR